MSSSVVILVAILVIWLGVLGYLAGLSRKINRLQRKGSGNES